MTDSCGYARRTSRFQYYNVERVSAKGTAGDSLKYVQDSEQDQMLQI
jgi:hypothetical protein